MTNYNERLDEIFNTLPVHGIISSDGIRDDYWDAVNARTKLKQALPSLIKELVAEAKPEITFSKPEGMPNTLAVDFTQRHLNQFEQNLLKELEEV